MIDDKTEKISISMPGSLLRAVDQHLSEIEEERSEYFRRLASADLAAAGKLPGSPEAEARAEFDATLAVTSPTELLAALRALRAAAAVERAT